MLGWTSIWTKSQALVIVVAALHLIGAYALTFAPGAQLFTQDTLPVFALFPPQVWAVAFLLGGLGAVSLLHRVTAFRQVFTWTLIIPTQTMWLGASLLAVLLTSGGSVMMVVYLAGVLAFTTITALVMAHDFTSGKR